MAEPWLDRASQLPLLATWKAACREPRYAGSAGILPALWTTENQEGKESS